MHEEFGREAVAHTHGVDLVHLGGDTWSLLELTIVRVLTLNKLKQSLQMWERRVKAAGL